MTFIKSVLAAGALALSASGLARADVLPPVAIYGYVTNGSQTATIQSVGTAGLSFNYSYTQGHGSVTTTFSGGAMSLTDIGVVSGASPAGLSSINDGNYYFEVSGPVGGTASVLLTAHGSTSVSFYSGWALVGVYVSAIDDGSTALFSSCSVGAGLGPPQAANACGDHSRQPSFTGQVEFTVPVGVQESVSITSGAANGYTAGAYQVSFDPMITFAPDFNADGYAIATSPDAGVPEPGAWSLMLIGMGAVGAAMRSRRQVLAAI